jgi:ABC-type dipeptide/oligopeptide/nickel transport system permease subunit
MNVRIKIFASSSLLWLSIVVLICIFAPFLTRYDPHQPVGPPLSLPNAQWIFGTDALGRDIWTRIVYGARLSLSASILSALLSIILGAIVGVISSSSPHWIDRFMMWFSNALLSIPGLLLAMILVAGLGPGLLTVTLAVGISGIPSFARISRTIFLQTNSQRYIQSARALGGGRLWIIRYHLIPNAFSQLLSFATVQVAWAFLGITTLTFLGMAGDPSTPEWGAMLNSGRLHLVEFPLLAILSGGAITLTIMSIHNLGTWFSRSTDPIRRHQQ